MGYKHRVGKWRGITNVLQEDLEHTTGLFVDETRDTLNTTTAGETADGLEGG